MENDNEAVRLREILRRLVRGIGLIDREDAACCGITLSQCHVLGEVALREGLTPGELAMRLRVDPSAVTRITDCLVQAGLLRRENDPLDRRLVRLFLTPGGWSLWDEMSSTMTQRAQAVISRLAPGERPDALAALERLVEALEHEGYLPRFGGTQGGSSHEQRQT